MAASVLALVPNELIVRQALPGADRIMLITQPRSEAAACPLCKQVSRRVHSHYQRRLVDLPWQGRIVELRVEARRFRCPNPGCSRSIFTERLGEAAAANARRTTRLGDVQRQIALAAGGKPGGFSAHGGVATKASLLAIEGTIHRVPGIGQRGRKLPVEIGIILDDEKTQATSFR